jgi:dihydrofolate reductase
LAERVTYPWRLPGDLKWFKKITLGHTLVMGRKTWESLPGALPGRQNWVLSRTASQEDGMRIFRSIEDILENKQPDQTIFIIGGGEIYSLALPLCHELYLTEVHQKVPDGDAFFPEFKKSFNPVETLDENNDFLLRRWIRSN